MKDFNSYKSEETQLKEKMEKAREEGRDEHDIKAMMQGIQETTDTLVQCKPRIQAALDDLENLIATYEEKPGDLFDALQ